MGRVPSSKLTNNIYNNIQCVKAKYPGHLNKDFLLFLYLKNATVKKKKSWKRSRNLDL